MPMKLSGLVDAGTIKYQASSAVVATEMKEQGFVGERMSCNMARYQTNSSEYQAM
jgi:hypothetical protein